MAIHQWPEQQRPREKLASMGCNQLSDSELLAILLRNAPAGLTALEMAQQLLNHFGNLANLFNSDFHQLKACNGLGPAKSAEIIAIGEIQKRILEQRLKYQQTLNSPKECRQLLIRHMRHLSHEQFAVIFLDNRHRVLHFQTLFYGTIDSSAVYPRTVVEQCLKHQAAAVIFAHNHPSGISEPSEADRLITHRLQQALLLIDVRVLDHFIVGDGLPYSMAEHGALSPC